MTMPTDQFELVTVPCLSDNYAFLLHAKDTGATALIDAPEAGPILAELRTRGWSLSEVWITHHHADHVQGLPEVLSAHKAKVRGASTDKARLPELDVAHADEDTFDFAGHPVRVMDVSGHTIGHIAFYVEAAGAVFTADSLMAMGCGRLFEGSAAQMWASLSKLSQLPGDTLVCSGHEYTETNVKFALTIDPDNPDLQARAASVSEARAQGKPTVPSRMALEIKTNPFLRAKDPNIRTRLDMRSAPDVDVFAEIRARKDAF
jgi:hydroxyacylglutathione hydrolase